MKQITVIIPCYNEAAAIGTVISNFPYDEAKNRGFNINVIVVDNNSTDDTTNIAKSHGAVVISERVKGKGNAMKKGFSSIPENTDYVVMLDGDDTYEPKEILRLVEPLDSGFCDVIIGSRLGGKIHHNSMPMFNRAGNWFYTHLVRYYYRVNVTDVLTGYFAWTKDSIASLNPYLESDGFAIEMEMITKMARMNQSIYSVPISYHPRSGISNLRPVRDGFKILTMFIRSLTWRP